MLGCEEELLPSWRSISSPDPERLAEERRLFYVAATRAKDRLLITHVAERGRRPTGGPSRFLAEAGLQQTRQPRWPPDPSARRRPPRRARGAGALTTNSRRRLMSQPLAHPGEPAGAHPRRGGRPVPPSVRARRDRLSRDDQGAVQRPAVRRRAGRRLHRRPVGDPAAERRRARPLAPAVPVAPGRVRPRRQPAGVPRLPADRHAAGRGGRPGRRGGLRGPRRDGLRLARRRQGALLRRAQARRRRRRDRRLPVHLARGGRAADRPARQAGAGDPPAGQERPARRSRRRPSSGCATATRRG